MWIPLTLSRIQAGYVMFVSRLANQHVGLSHVRAYEQKWVINWDVKILIIKISINSHDMSITNIYIYIYIYKDYWISFQTFFVQALLFIVHAWNSSPLRSNLLRLQCTCYTVHKTSGRPFGSPLVWACQWPSSQPLSSPQLSHNDSLWA